eukprot:6182568-Pleurochrysis_carterae.AAC.1
MVHGVGDAPLLVQSNCAAFEAFRSALPFGSWARATQACWFTRCTSVRVHLLTHAETYQSDDLWLSIQPLWPSIQPTRMSKSQEKHWKRAHADADGARCAPADRRMIVDSDDNIVVADVV